MAYVLQVDFPMDGPFGEEMTESFAGLAASINEEDGFIWKIWTEDSQEKLAGGIYLFETKETAQKYLEMHSERLIDFGFETVNAKIFAVNEGLSKITHGPLK
ncbi:monooxygenase [Oceanobacillus chungangensis]|uniref:Monooxygenase n=1 Tax=Oceanobacillus chungangensis TaxID=1229152 RepID=A0A3D8PHZ1_9BACI|nr:monooxygenase [Oceanobacillus chungangensis]RDW15716.1 monooxygenase [Oceanobacillus chungangensis]